MSQILKTPIAKELESIKKKLSQRKRSSFKRELKEFVLLVTAILTASGLYDLIVWSLKHLNIIE